MSKHITAAQAAALLRDGDIVSVSSSSGLGCPDKVLAAIGERFEREGAPRNLTTLHPIAAGDMYGIKGMDHLARPGLLSRVLAGSYPSGPSSLPMPAIWRMVVDNQIQAYNIPSGILFDMHREAAARRPGVLTQAGMGTFVDPAQQGCAMNEPASRHPVVRLQHFDGRDWLFFPAVAPDVTVLRATTADERGNLGYEHEGALLGALEQAMAARNNGGIVIAQVKRIVRAGHLRPHDVRVPCHLVDHVVVDADQWQTTQTVYDPAISGEVAQPLSGFEPQAWGPEKVIARRAAMELGISRASLYSKLQQHGLTVGFLRVLHGLLGRFRRARRRLVHLHQLVAAQRGALLGDSPRNSGGLAARFSAWGGTAAAYLACVRANSSDTVTDGEASPPIPAPPGAMRQDEATGDAKKTVPPLPINSTAPSPIQDAPRSRAVQASNESTSPGTPITLSGSSSSIAS